MDAEKIRRVNEKAKNIGASAKKVKRKMETFARVLGEECEKSDLDILLEDHPGLSLINIKEINRKLHQSNLSLSGYIIVHDKLSILRFSCQGEDHDDWYEAREFNKILELAKDTTEQCRKALVGRNIPLNYSFDIEGSIYLHNTDKSLDEVNYFLSAYGDENSFTDLSICKEDNENYVNDLKKNMHRTFDIIAIIIDNNNHMIEKINTIIEYMKERGKDHLTRELWEEIKKSGVLE